MKKNLIKFAAVIFCAMLATVFTSCDKENNPNNNNNAASDDALSVAGMAISIKITDDLFSLLDLTVEYYDADGKIKSEVMTSPVWHKDIEANLPCKLGARVKMVAKAGAKPSGTIDTHNDIFYSACARSRNGKNQGEMVYNNSAAGVYNIPASGLDSYIKNTNGVITSFLFEFNAKGEPKKLSW